MLSCKRILKVLMLSLTRPKGVLNKLLQTTYIHVHLSLFTLPVILFWGFPLAPWAVLGNLIFAPFLSLFLLASSVLFITEVLHIPNYLVVAVLNVITVFWKSALHFTPSTPYVLSSPHILITCIIGLIGAFIVHTRNTTLLERMCYLLILTASTWTYLYCFCQPKAALKSFSPTLLYVKTKETALCIDRGTRLYAQDQKIASWFKTLSYDQDALHILIFLKPTTSAPRIAKLFLKGIHQALIVLPQSEYEKPTPLTRAIDELLAWSKQRNYVVIHVKEGTILPDFLGLCFNVKGKIRRSPEHQQTLFTLKSSLFASPLLPVITRREREQLQHRLKQAVDT